jgi:hypothetical protein
MSIIVKKIALRFRLALRRLRTFLGKTLDGQKRLMATRVWSANCVHLKRLPPRSPELADRGASTIPQTLCAGCTGSVGPSP